MQHAAGKKQLVKKASRRYITNATDSRIEATKAAGSMKDGTRD